MEAKEAVLNVLDLIDKQNELNGAVAAALGLLNAELERLDDRVTELERAAGLRT